LAKAGQSAIIILKIREDPLEGPADFKLIEERMTHLAGITSLEVNFLSSILKVHYNPTVLTAKRIREKLHEIEKLARRK
jgi:hypothetical protein